MSELIEDIIEVTTRGISRTINSSPLMDRSSEDRLHVVAYNYLTTESHLDTAHFRELIFLLNRRHIITDIDKFIIAECFFKNLLVEQQDMKYNILIQRFAVLFGDRSSFVDNFVVARFHRFLFRPYVSVNFFSDAFDSYCRSTVTNAYVRKFVVHYRTYYLESIILLNQSEIIKYLTSRNYYEKIAALYASEQSDHRFRLAVLYHDSCKKIISEHEAVSTLNTIFLHNFDTFDAYADIFAQAGMHTSIIAVFLKVVSIFRTNTEMATMYQMFYNKKLLNSVSLNNYTKILLINGNIDCAKEVVKTALAKSSCRFRRWPSELRDFIFNEESNFSSPEGPASLRAALYNVKSKSILRKYWRDMIQKYSQSNSPDLDITVDNRSKSLEVFMEFLGRIEGLRTTTARRLTNPTATANRRIGAMTVVQLDGLWRIFHENYVIECKWHANPISWQDVSNNVSPPMEAYWIIVVSMSGYNDNFHFRRVQHNTRTAQKVLALDRKDIENVLNYEKSLHELLVEKVGELHGYADYEMAWYEDGALAAS